MGCFCRQAVEALSASGSAQVGATLAANGSIAVAASAQVGVTLPAVDAAIPAIAAWLAARLLPAPAWAPDPAWLEVTLPDAPMPPAALGVLVSLVQACKSALDELGLNLAHPGGAVPLARIIGTLNRRSGGLDVLLQDARPWEALATLNAQIDTVADALAKGCVTASSALSPSLSAVAGTGVGAAAELQAGAGLPGSAGLAMSAGAPHGPPLAPWRPLIRQIRALAPLISIGQMLNLDFGAPDAAERLTQLIRNLRAIVLPPLENTTLILRAVARMDAVARLRVSFGVDPRLAPFERVVRAVERKALTVRQALPTALRVVDGRLLGMAERPPNPSLLLNAATLAIACRIVPDQMRWNPPPYAHFALLTAGVPAMALNRAMAALGTAPILAAPCGHGCDAGSVARELGITA